MKLVKNRTEFLNHLATLLPKDNVCLELGVYFGEFSQQIHDILIPSKLFLVDPWERGSDENGANETYGEALKELPTAYSDGPALQAVKDKFPEQINEGTVIIKKGFSYEALASFPNDFFDFIYVDACHLYDCVKADLKMYAPKLKKTGLMCGHDHTPSWDGVAKAVDEFVLSHDFEWIAHEKSKGDWALRSR